MVKRAIHEIRQRLRGSQATGFPLTPPLPLPDGITEQQLFDFVASVRVQDAPETEMRAYGTHDFRRFVYTRGLARDVKGKCLELGSGPYFSTMLLKLFTDLDISLVNYFGYENNGEFAQTINHVELDGGKKIGDVRVPAFQCR